MADVKGPVPKHRARAAATRARIVRAAYELFVEHGYRATTMEAIGRRAGVAVQTVYFAFRTKDDLLQAVHEWTVLGDDPTPPAQQPWHVSAMAEPDAGGALPKVVAGIATIDARIAPMIPVFHAVAQDPAGEVYRRSEQRRRHDMDDLLDALARKTPLLPAITRTRAADLIFFLTGPESYQALVVHAGWSQEAWVRWVSHILCRDLFEDAASSLA